MAYQVVSDPFPACVVPGKGAGTPSPVSLFSLHRTRLSHPRGHLTTFTTRFANPAVYGDLLAALLAFLAILALRRRWRIAIPLVWVFNMEGTLDLLNAVTPGLRYTEDGNLGATFFIPAMIVPAFLLTHVMVFIILLREESEKGHA